MEEKTERNIFIRILSGIFWFVLTVLLIQILVGAVVGGVAGLGVDTGSSFSDAYNAGAAAGEQQTLKFFNEHGGKVFIFEVLAWLCLLITGKYPGVSKFKVKKA